MINYKDTYKKGDLAMYLGGTYYSTTVPNIAIYKVLKVNKTTYRLEVMYMSGEIKEPKVFSFQKYKTDRLTKPISKIIALLKYGVKI